MSGVSTNALGTDRLLQGTALRKAQGWRCVSWQGAELVFDTSQVSNGMDPCRI